MGCTISTATRDCDPQEDPSDDRSFPFFLSASILRHQQAEPFSIPERTCYPSHGMGPMSVMGGRGGMGVQWQPSLQSVSRFSEISRHQMTLGGSGVERVGVQQQMIPGVGMATYQGHDSYKSISRTGMEAVGMMRTSGMFGVGTGGWGVKDSEANCHGGGEIGMEGDMGLMAGLEMRAPQAYPGN